jgi:hypothetical protein
MKQCNAERDAARGKLNAIESRSAYSSNEQDDAYDDPYDELIDAMHLWSIQDRKHSLMIYECNVNGRKGRAMTDTPVKPIKDTFMVFSKTSFLRPFCIMNGDFTNMNEYFKVYSKMFINRGK